MTDPGPPGTGNWEAGTGGLTASREIREAGAWADGRSAGRLCAFRDGTLPVRALPRDPHASGRCSREEEAEPAGTFLLQP